MALKYGQTSDTSVTDNTYSFRLGHVERVFTSKNDVQILTNIKTESQLIEFTDVEALESSKTKYLAVPLLRGVNDSITRGDLVMYTILGGKYFYLGPVNTNNTPSNSSDHTYNPKKGNRFFNKDLRKDRVDGYNRNIPNLSIPKLSKPRFSPLDFPGVLKNPQTQEFAESNFSDLTLEGRYGNAIRIGARNQFPQLMITNNNTSYLETLGGGGSVFAMTSIGTIVDNFPLDRGFQLSSDIKINEAYQNDDSGYKSFALGFNYDYGQIKPIDGDEEQSEFDQVIISSDRIIFNSTEEDITLSSNRNIKIGAAENIEMTNKGYSVFESRNIYIGRKAKDRSQPMVLGEELRRLLTRILRLIADAQALGDYNVPQPLTVFPNVLQAGSLKTEVDNIMKEFNLGSLVPGQNPPSPDPEYDPYLKEDKPVGDRAYGNATFMSQHHFIETNRE